MTSLASFISVAAGGAIGASLRFGVSVWLAPASKFPLPTLMVNVLGCFFAGMVATVLLSKSPDSANAQLFVITGLLGGFTTFSAFSLETLRFFEAGNSGLALLNVVANVAGSLLAVVFGWWLARSFLL